MSVLECNRYNCQNIMCDRYSHEYGYICNECFLELVDSGIDTDIETFMYSSKKLDYEQPREPYKRYDKEFPIT